MPAVTVEDTTTLPRVPLPAPGTVRRRTRSVTTAPSGFEGEGFPVRRAFAGVDLRDLDPFIHMDQMGEVEYAPGEPKDRKSTRLNSSHMSISYAVFCLKKKKINKKHTFQYRTNHSCIRLAH